MSETFREEAVAAPSRPRMATSRRHPPFLFFGPPIRPTTQTPRNTQQPRGLQDRGTPGQMKAGARTASDQVRVHFAWVLRSSRQVGAGSRGRATTDGSPAPNHNYVMTQNFGAPAQRRAMQPRPCARAATTRPATANYPPVRRECKTAFIPSRYAHHTTTSPHHYILHRTLRPSQRAYGHKRA